MVATWPCPPSRYAFEWALLWFHGFNSGNATACSCLLAYSSSYSIGRPKPVTPGTRGSAARWKPPGKLPCPWLALPPPAQGVPPKEGGTRHCTARTATMAMKAHSCSCRCATPRKCSCHACGCSCAFLMQMAANVSCHAYGHKCVLPCMWLLACCSHDCKCVLACLWLQMWFVMHVAAKAPCHACGCECVLSCMWLLVCFPLWLPGHGACV